MADESGCLIAILKLFSAGRAAPKPLPFKRKDYLLTQAERSLFGVLQQIAKDQYFIFAKVRLADLLWMPKGTESRQSHFNRIQAKHVDFVLCDRTTVRPLVCVELDDASHRESSRQARDTFVDAALAAADLPIVRVIAAKAYNVAELSKRIEVAMSSQRAQL